MTTDFTDALNTLLEDEFDRQESGDDSNPQALDGVLEALYRSRAAERQTFSEAVQLAAGGSRIMRPESEHAIALLRAAGEKAA